MDISKFRIMSLEVFTDPYALEISYLTAKAYFKTLKSSVWNSFRTAIFRVGLTNCSRIITSMIEVLSAEFQTKPSPRYATSISNGTSPSKVSIGLILQLDLVWNSLFWKNFKQNSSEGWYDLIYSLQDVGVLGLGWKPGVSGREQGTSRSRMARTSTSCGSLL